MRYESSVTSLSWIPSEAIEGATRLPFDVGMAHYDPPPPDELGSLDELRQADRFRFANRAATRSQSYRVPAGAPHASARLSRTRRRARLRRRNKD